MNINPEEIENLTFDDDLVIEQERTVDLQGLAEEASRLGFTFDLYFLEDSGVPYFGLWPSSHLREKAGLKPDPEDCEFSSPSLLSIEGYLTGYDAGQRR